MFSWVSLRDLFIFSLRASVIFIKAILRSFSCALAILQYSGPAVVLIVFHAGFQTSGFGKIVIVGADICFCLCWVGVLCPDFCCPVWFLGECGDCVLPGRTFFWDSVIYGHWEFQEKLVSRCWNLILRNRNRLRSGC